MNSKRTNPQTNASTDDRKLRRNAPATSSAAPKKRKLAVSIERILHLAERVVILGWAETEVVDVRAPNLRTGEISCAPVPSAETAGAPPLSDRKIAFTLALIGKYEEQSPLTFTLFFADRRKRKFTIQAAETNQEANIERVAGRIFSIRKIRSASNSQISSVIQALSAQEWRAFLIIRSNFDAKFYKYTYKLEIEDELELAIHYLKRGWREGNDPNSWFSVEAYLLDHSDVAQSGLEPFLHYLQVGRQEGRSIFPHVNREKSQIAQKIAPFIDQDYYKSQVGNVNLSNAANHYVLFGEQRRINPHKNFDINQYLMLNPDVRNANISPFLHYVDHGIKEGRKGRVERNNPRQSNDTRPCLLFVGHSARQAGAEVMLLDIVRWFNEHTDYELDVILLAPGILSSEYASHANTIVINGVDDFDYLLESDFLRSSYELIYFNTVATSEFALVYNRIYLPRLTSVLMHVHEMESVLREFREPFQALEPSVGTFIAASDRTAQALSETCNVHADRIQTMHSFVRAADLDQRAIAAARESARRAFDIPETAFVVLGSGTVYLRKGPDLFFETAVSIIKANPNKEMYFIWIGSGELLSELNQKVQDLNLAERIKFVGFHKNAAELVAMADVFFLSSREDPFPLVCLEAAQFGIPSVIFRESTGFIEFVGNDAGVISERTSADSAARSIKEIMVDPRRREILGLNARRKFLTHFETQIAMIRFLTLLRDHCGLKPKVTVAIPNYNHEKFLVERIESVVNQTFKDVEILLMDDCSSDNSLAILSRYAAEDPRCRLVINDHCSGSPFPQWHKAQELGVGELIWIAESDDFCDLKFLQFLIPYFDDPLVALAYCRTEIVREDGSVVQDALKEYFGPLETDLALPAVREGRVEARDRLGVICTIVNASSVIFRKEKIAEGFRAAVNYRISGDWRVYLEAAKNGRVVYADGVNNYFRRHGDSVVHKIEGTEQYFEERGKILKFAAFDLQLGLRWFRRARTEIESEWERFRHVHKARALAEIIDFDAVRRVAEGNEAEPMLRIGLYVHGMCVSKGGIERLAADLANEWVSAGHEVFIFCRRWEPACPVYPLGKMVRLVPCFDETEGDASLLGIQNALADSNVDVFIPMLSEQLFEPMVEAASRLGIKTIASEHNDPWQIEKRWWPRGRRIATLRRVDRIHFILDKYASSIPKSFRDRVSIISNGVRIDRIQAIASMVRRNGRRIISAGRLEPQKRFDRLIKAFAAIEPRCRRDWRLDIFGAGSMHESLLSLIASMDLGHSVRVLPPTDVLWRELSRSDIFVLPSEFEAFGITVVEAKAAGLPCIAYSNCNGPNILIRNEVDGLLCAPDEEGENLAEAIRWLISDPDFRLQLAGRATENLDRFDIRRIARDWLHLIRQTVSATIDPSG